GPPLLSNAHRHLDRRALESEGLTQAAGDEPPVAVVEEAGGEQHELRRTRLRLRAEEDARLLAAAHGVRIGGDQLTEEGVEPARRDACVPALESGLHRGHELLGMTTGLRGDIHPR